MGGAWRKALLPVQGAAPLSSNDKIRLSSTFHGPQLTVSCAFALPAGEALPNFTCGTMTVFTDRIQSSCRRQMLLCKVQTGNSAGRGISAIAAQISPLKRSAGKIACPHEAESAATKNFGCRQLERMRQVVWAFCSRVASRPWMPTRSYFCRRRACSHMFARVPIEHELLNFRFRLQCFHTATGMKIFCVLLPSVSETCTVRIMAGTF